MEIAPKELVLGPAPTLDSLGKVRLGKYLARERRIGPGMRPTFVSRPWDLLKGGGDIKGNFKEGNLSNIDVVREKRTYEDIHSKARDLNMFKKEHPAMVYIILILLP